MRERFTSSTKRAAVTAEDFRQNVQALQGDLARLTQQATLLFGDVGDKAMGELTDGVHWLGKNFDGVVSTANKRGRRALADASDGLVGGIQEAVTKRPLTTLALAAGLGIIFGTLSSRR